MMDSNKFAFDRVVDVFIFLPRLGIRRADSNFLSVSRCWAAGPTTRNSVIPTRNLTMVII